MYKPSVLIAIIIFSVVVFLILFLLIFRSTSPTPNKTLPGESPNIPITSSPPQPKAPPSSSTPEQFKQAMDKQAADDKAFGQFVSNIYDNYPWYNSLPLQTSNYFVYFDINKKIFIAQLYPKTSSPTPIDTQIENSKKEVTDKLQNLGVDLSKYNIQWESNPTP